jgi:hypothetical protein
MTSSLSYFYEFLHTNWIWKVQNFPENSEIPRNERIPYYYVLDDNVQPISCSTNWLLESSAECGMEAQFNMLTAFALCRYIFFKAILRPILHFSICLVFGFKGNVNFLFIL